MPHIEVSCTNLSMNRRKYRLVEGYTEYTRIVLLEQLNPADCLYIGYEAKMRGLRNVTKLVFVKRDLDLTHIDEIF